MKAFLKDNIALVAAIVLPALLAVFFALSTVLTAVSVESPKNDFLVATDYYESNSNFSFSVNNDKLTVSYRPDEKDDKGNYAHRYTNRPRLWRVNVPEMSVQEIALTEPENKKAQDISVPGATDAKITNLTPGPDGYAYIDNYRYGNNIMTELFSMGSDRRQSSGITKDGRVVSFRIPDGKNYSYNTQFIGWIVEE